MHVMVIMKCEHFIKHSSAFVKKYIIRNYLPVILAFVLLVPAWAQAQMFSVGENRPDRGIPSTAFYLGLEPAAFDYRGPSGGGAYEFNGSVVRLRLESRGLDVYLGTGGRLSGLDDVSYFDAGVQVRHGLSVLRRSRLMIQLPVQLTTGIASAVNRNTVGLNTQFQQGSLVAGLGAYVHARPANRLRLEASLIPSYGFSFATGNTFGGSLGMLEMKTRLYFDRLFGDMGLTVGYDYNFRRYDIEEDTFDYDLKAHSILIGITF